MALRKFGPNTLLTGQGFQFNSGARMISGTGFPASGTSGTGVGINGGPAVGSIYFDKTSGVHFQNDGTALSPYWYPVSMDQRGIVGVNTTFNKSHGRAAGVDNFLGGSASTSGQDDGVRNFGLGINETTNTDYVVSYPVGGPLLTMGTENQANYMSALGYGSTTALWTPAANGTIVVEAYFTAITDILTRSIFLGLVGESVAAMVPPVAGSTVTMTFEATGTQGDNVHGLFMDSRLTAASSIFLPSVKANAVASVSTTVAALTTASTMPAAATYTRWRIEVSPAGTLTAFVDKAQVHTVASAVSTTVALMPMFGQTNTTTTAALSLGIRRFAAYAAR